MRTDFVQKSPEIRYKLAPDQMPNDDLRGFELSRMYPPSHILVEMPTVDKDALLVSFFEQNLIRKKLPRPQWLPEQSTNSVKAAAIRGALGQLDHAPISFDAIDIKWIKRQTPRGLCWIDSIPRDLGRFSASSEIVQELLIDIAHHTRFFDPKINEFVSSQRAELFFTFLSQSEFNLILSNSSSYLNEEPGPGDHDGIIFCRRIMGEGGLEYAKDVIEKKCPLDIAYLKLAAFGGLQRKLEVGKFLEEHLQRCYATTLRKYSPVCTPRVKLCSALIGMVCLALGLFAVSSKT